MELCQGLSQERSQVRMQIKQLRSFVELGLGSQKRIGHKVVDASADQYRGATREKM